MHIFCRPRRCRQDCAGTGAQRRRANPQAAGAGNGGVAAWCSQRGASHGQHLAASGSAGRDGRAVRNPCRLWRFYGIFGTCRHAKPGAIDVRPCRVFRHCRPDGRARHPWAAKWRRFGPLRRSGQQFQCGIWRNFQLQFRLGPCGQPGSSGRAGCTLDRKRCCQNTRGREGVLERPARTHQREHTRPTF